MHICFVFVEDTISGVLPRLIVIVQFSKCLPGHNRSLSWIRSNICLGCYTPVNLVNAIDYLLWISWKMNMSFCTVSIHVNQNCKMHVCQSLCNVLGILNIVMLFSDLKLLYITTTTTTIIVHLVLSVFWTMNLASASVTKLFKEIPLILTFQARDTYCI